jgi:hypothetical protein
MKTICQLLREFWLPFVISIGWSGFVYTQKPFGIVAGVTTFGAAFFLFSWATGQFFRVSKQLRVEERFSNVGDRLENLTKQIEQQTSSLLASISGGDSFCEFRLIPNTDESPSNSLIAIHVGENPLYNVNARVVDLDDYDLIIHPKNLEEATSHDYNFELGDMIAEHAQLAGDIKFWKIGATSRRLNIFWTARNGGFSQILRYEFREGKWFSATRIRKNNGAKSEVIYEKIDAGYPVPLE